MVELEEKPARTKPGKAKTADDIDSEMIKWLGNRG